MKRCKVYWRKEFPRANTNIRLRPYGVEYFGYCDNPPPNTRERRAAKKRARQRARQEIEESLDLDLSGT